MKASTVFSLLFSAICVFNIGIYYGAHPYRELELTELTKQDLSRIALEQGHVSLMLSLIGLVLILISTALTVIEKLRRPQNA